MLFSHPDISCVHPPQALSDFYCLKDALAYKVCPKLFNQIPFSDARLPFWTMNTDAPTPNPDPTQNLLVKAQASQYILDDQGEAHLHDSNHRFSSASSPKTKVEK